MNNFHRFFPVFRHQKKLVYLDSAATSLKPSVVIKGILDYYRKYSLSTRSGTSSPGGREVAAIVEKTRKIIACRIQVQTKEVIFVPSATYALNILALSLKKFVEKGDKIYLTYLEHSSNFYPWQALAQERGAKIDFLPLNKNFIIDIDCLEKHIDKKTKIVSFFHVSNSLGTANPVAKITKKIKAINPHCLVIIDACQSIAHLPINVKEWGIEALVFSGHKVYGPTGIGVLWLRKELGQKLPDLLWGGGKTINPNEKMDATLPLAQKFEVGTLPLAQIFGLKKSFEFLSSLDIEEVNSYKKELKDYVIKELVKLKKILIYNQNLETINIVIFNFEGFHAHDVADYLGKNNVCVRAGNFCCPYLKELIGVEAALRISLSIYNDRKDIDKLIYYLKKLEKQPKLIFSYFCNI